MARPLTHSLPSDTLEAAVRTQFGLSQEELARYLGVTRGLVAYLEAGRRPPTAALTRRLGYLAALLPPPTGHGPAAPRFGVPEPLPKSRPAVPPHPAGLSQLLYPRLLVTINRPLRPCRGGRLRGGQGRRTVRSRQTLGTGLWMTTARHRSSSTGCRGPARTSRRCH